MTITKKSPVFKTEFKGTNRFWYFDNGQWGEKTEIKERDCYSILFGDNDRIFGLVHYQENDCGGGRLNSMLSPVCSLNEKEMKIYNNLLSMCN